MMSFSERELGENSVHTKEVVTGADGKDVIVMVCFVRLQTFFRKYIR